MGGGSLGDGGYSCRVFSVGIVRGPGGPGEPGDAGAGQGLVTSAPHVGGGFGDGDARAAGLLAPQQLDGGGWQARVDLEEGLRRTVDWAREHFSR